MKALVSGQAGAFVVATGAGFLYRGLDGMGGIQAEARDLRYIFAGCNDVLSIDVKNESDAALATLTLSSANRAVRYFLILFEPEETLAERREVAHEIEGLLRSEDIVDLVERQLFCDTLPLSLADIISEIAEIGAARFLELGQTLLLHQASIRRTVDLFEAIPEAQFDPSWPRNRVRETAIDSGWFRDIAKAVQDGQDVSFLVMKMLAKREIPNIRLLVASWTNSLQHRRISYKPQAPDADVEEVLSDGDGAGGRAKFENAMAQQAAIVGRLRQGDIEHAREFTADLVAQQSTMRSSEYVAKSLCRLSQEAKHLHISPLQLEWAELASRLAPEDPWAHGQYADALIQHGRYVEAALALEQAALHGDEAYALTGRARILRAQSRLSEARETFLEAARLFDGTENALHAIAGAAGVLREMGLLEESLREYNQALGRYPGTQLFVNGRAATYTELGLFDLAMSDFASLRSDPANAILARNGIANLQKLSGSLEQAAASYRKIVADYPYDPISPSGLADVLRLQGKLAESLDTYRGAQSKFPYTPVPYSGAAGVLAELGNIPAALAEIERGLSKFPNDVRLRLSQSAIGFRTSGENSLSNLDQIVTHFPQLFSAKVQRADTLRRLGEVSLAEAAYRDILLSHPNFAPALNGMAGVLLHKGNLEDAGRLLSRKLTTSQEDWRAHILKGIWLARSGKQAEARTHLKAGLKKVAFARERQLMSATLGWLCISRNRYAEAANVIRPSPDDISAVIRLHALAFSQRVGPARATYETIKNVAPDVAVLRDEIAKRYGVIPGQASKSIAWIVLEEQRALALEAA